MKCVVLAEILLSRKIDVDSYTVNFSNSKNDYIMAVRFSKLHDTLHYHQTLQEEVVKQMC